MLVLHYSEITAVHSKMYLLNIDVTKMYENIKMYTRSEKYLKSIISLSLATRLSKTLSVKSNSNKTITKLSACAL